MGETIPSKMLQIQSLVKKDGTLELSLVEVPVPEPGDDEVLIRVEAAPINPSDLGLLFGPADQNTISVTGDAERPVVTAKIPEELMGAVAARVGESLPAGNEGAGVVVSAGSADAAQKLIGKTVAVAGGSMYSQYRAVKERDCLVLKEGTTPEEGASCFVNPLTALGMVETMKMEGHTALVHTAAASNLGQMLVKICKDDGVPLVNIVRKQEHVDLLKGIGADYVCNSSDDDFTSQLTDALEASGATLAFDATGGGKLASQILTCMERAAVRKLDGFSRYGSTVHKQVYIYGGLERSPTVLTRNYGMNWGLGGWLLTPFLQKVGPEKAEELRQRVANEIKTTFASSYTKTVSLAEALQADSIAVYGKQATGEKYLIKPNA
ncbi:MAG: zinc-binding dehydrogenase [Pseudomonadales bacterium]|nr:zinc-binding dehydrogenase [Pseudomonadales bacterium]